MPTKALPATPPGALWNATAIAGKLLEEVLPATKGFPEASTATA